MKDQKKARWILGSSGVILSALLLTQINNETTSEASGTAVADKAYTKQQEEKMSATEKELVNLDWTNFEIVTTTREQPIQSSERTTKRS